MTFNSVTEAYLISCVVFLYDISGRVVVITHKATLTIANA
jgi:hypothetical protein